MCHCSVSSVFVEGMFVVSAVRTNGKACDIVPVLDVQRCQSQSTGTPAILYRTPAPWLTRSVREA